MDLASLGFLVATLFGLVAGDAVIGSDTLHLEFGVAGEFSKQGIDKTTAEGLFDHHVSKITRHRSIVRPVQVVTSQHKSVVAALAEDLRLAPLTAAVQDFAGLAPIRLHGSLLAIDSKSRLILAGYDTRRRPLLLELERPLCEALPLLNDGASDLVRVVDPYHYALDLLEDHSDDPAARARLATHLEAQRHPTLGATTVMERGLFENLAGILALLEDDTATAERNFLRSVTLLPDQFLAHLNVAFLRVHQDRFGDAVKEVEVAMERFDRRTPADMRVAAHLVRGVARRALGDTDGARTDFQRAIKLEPNSDAAYTYWSMIEKAAGNSASADKLAKLGAETRAQFDVRPELAAHYFWLSPGDEGPLRRRRDR